ncbi:PE family protein [Antrihabitans cavernicola]|uniref:PE family protein n=1 Tax=Antrihabitans cavernicola TaxID=2495913 RepID=A0A5A7S4Z6_9NOCA|nr:PE family protein [Spelaeibacter cavernicola]KAA0016542.1 PE family protein [Spelaeibacter cavernicola]
MDAAGTTSLSVLKSVEDSLEQLRVEGLLPEEEFVRLRSAIASWLFYLVANDGDAMADHAQPAITGIVPAGADEVSVRAAAQMNATAEDFLTKFRAGMHQFRRHASHIDRIGAVDEPRRHIPGTEEGNNH